MIIFLKSILKYLLYVLTIGMIYLLLIDVVFKPHLKSRLFNNSLFDVKILITGTSHTLYGLDPEIMSLKTINIAEICKPLLIDLEIIKKYHKALPSLEFVIVPIDYFTLFYNGQNNKVAKRYWYHWDLLKMANIKNINLGMFHFLDCSIETPLGVLKNEMSLNNFQPKFGIFDPVKDKEEVETTIDEWHENWIEFQNYQNIHNELLDFLDFCKVEGLKVVFVSMPTPISMRKKYKTQFCNITNTALRTYVDEFNASCIDFNDSVLFNNDSLYDDCSHLNYKGANLATKMLNNKIINMYPVVRNNCSE